MTRRVSPSNAVAANDGLTGNPAHEYDQRAIEQAHALRACVHTLFTQATAGSRLFVELGRPWRAKRYRWSLLWLWLRQLAGAHEPSPAWNEDPVVRAPASAPGPGGWPTERPRRRRSRS